MANVDNASGFVVANASGGPVPIKYGTTKSNLTLTAGDLIIMLTTGLIDIAVAGSTAIHGLCVQSVTAVAATQKTVAYVPALETIEFEGQCSGTMAQTDIGEAVDIEGTTGIMEVNEDANSTAVIRITDLAKNTGNAVGANARVKFVVNKSSYTGQA